MDIVDLNNLLEKGVVHFVNSDKSVFCGNVKKIQNEYIGISVHTRQDNYRILNSKKAIEFLLSSEREAYRCSASILGCTFTDEYEHVILSKPTVLNKIERRRYQRLQTVVDIYYCTLPNDCEFTKIAQVPSFFYRKLKKTFTIDISAGGVCLIAYEDTNISGNLLITLILKGEEITTLCKVVRVEPIEGTKTQRLALEFIDIDKRHREYIFKYVKERINDQQNNIKKVIVV